MKITFANHIIRYALYLFMAVFLSNCGGCSGGGGEGSDPAPAVAATPIPIYRIAGDSHGNGMGASGAMNAVYGVTWECDAIAGIKSDILVKDWPKIIDGANRIVVFIGTNDCKLSGGAGTPMIPTPFTVFQSRVLWMIEQAEIAGVQLLWCNIPPDAGYMGDPTKGQTDPALVHQINAWLRTLQRANLTIIDFNKYAADPLDPDVFNPALSSDGVHLMPAKYGGFARHIYDHDPWR